MKLNKRKAFTLAEVLITLSIIGVIAAILFPSILANYNERTLKAKRQALYGRMSQAMGQMADTFRNYASTKNREKTSAEVSSGYVPNCSIKPGDCIDDGSALKFISEGLSQYYKIAAICDADTMTACDVPPNITLADGSNFPLKDAKNWQSYFPQVTINSTDNFYYDVNTAAFRTKNGESILLWYNPNCASKSIGAETHLYVSQVLCVNMVYDLNGGKNKPNKVGEDIGFMSVFYNDAPVVVSPKPYDWKGVPDVDSTMEGTIEYVNQNLTRTFAEAKAACAALGDNVRLPSLEEGMSMLFNREIWAPMEKQTPMKSVTTGYVWTSTWLDRNLIWVVEFTAKNRINQFFSYVQAHEYYSNYYKLTRCVYDN